MVILRQDELKTMNLAQSKIGEAQEQVVRNTLRSILDSTHFSKSTRYPAFLERVVLGTLEGQGTALKERALAIDVFGRSIDYDPSNDSVVRVAAGEVRKRLAQYFNEHPEAPVRIDLPVGSYLAEFHFPMQATNGASHELPKFLSEAVPATTRPDTAGTETARGASSGARYRQIGAGALALLFIAWAAILYLHKADPARDFWKTLIPTGQQALILTGKISNYNPPLGSIYSPQASREESNFYTGSALPLQDAIIVAQVCGFLYENHHPCNLADAASEPLQELTGRVLVLVGGFNNTWSVRLLAPLPYHLQLIEGKDQDAPVVRAISEHKANGDTPLWMTHPDTSETLGFVDYVILARFHSDITNSTVVVIAGIDRAGTLSGGTYLASQQNLAQLFAMSPKGWQGNNFEAVLQTRLLSGSSGHPAVVAAKFW